MMSASFASELKASLSPYGKAESVVDLRESSRLSVVHRRRGPTNHRQASTNIAYPTLLEFMFRGSGRVSDCGRVKVADEDGRSSPRDVGAPWPHHHIAMGLASMIQR
jgi:hypothetical protein